MRNVQLLSWVPPGYHPVPGCVGQGLAAQITVFLFLPPKILISDFLNILQLAHLVKINVAQSETAWGHRIMEWFRLEWT